MGKLYGSTEPRIWTKPLRKLTRRTSRGFEVIDWVENVLGETLYPHQKWLLIHTLETMPRTGRLRFRHVLVTKPRRNAKTHTVNMLSAYHLAHGPANILGSSSMRETARETFIDLAHLVEDHDEDVFPQVKPRYANGQEEISFRAQKSRYKIVATNRRGGRSLTAKLAIEDELREHPDWTAHSALEPTIISEQDGQLWMLSNAGDRTSIVLNTLRARALDDIKEDNSNTPMFYAEWSAPDECEVDDREAWAMANPLMNRLWDESALEAAMIKPASEFRTENLNQSVPSLDQPVDPAEWEACLDPGTLDQHRSRVTACLDISLDGRHLTLVAAASLPDGRVRVETVAAWESTSEMRQELPELLSRVKPRVVGWFPSSASAISTDLKEIKNNKEISGSEVKAACAGLADQVKAVRVAHSGDELLTSQVLGARKLNVGDGWVFSRRDGGWCDATYATAGAVHLARQFPALSNKPLRLITART